MSFSFYVHTLGCKVNRSESDTITLALLMRGGQLTSAQEADVCIVNTCTVTGEADTKNRKTIRALLKHNPKAVIVTGCGANIDARKYQEIDKRIVIELDKERVAQVAQDLVDESGALEALDTSIDIAESLKDRCEIKVQDGCNNACTYCIVHTARGKARSTAAPEVLQNAQRLIDAGIPELVLVGIDLGAYKEPSTGEGLSSLVTRVLELCDTTRVRLSSIEPQSVEGELITLLAQSDGTLCRHLHLPLQSGSDKVLKEMARHYDASTFLRLVQNIRTACPQIALSTDVIVGFPGESDDDFEQTCQLITECAFSRLHIFRYSKRQGTPAAERSDQIDPVIKAQRAKHLQALGQQLALQDMQKRVGSTETVVVEKHVDATHALGTSESYHSVAIEGTCPQSASVRVEFHDIDTQKGMLIGKIL